MTITRQKLARWDMPMGDAVTERRHGGGYRCGFGGDSSSESNPVNTTTTVNTDKRLVVDGMSNGLSFDASSGNTITMLDAGAIAGAGSVVSSALDAVGGTLKTTLNTVNDVTSNALAAMGVTSSAAIGSATASAKTLMTEGSKLVAGQQQANSNNFGTLLGAMLELNKASSHAMDSNLSLTKELAGSANAAYADATATASGTKNIVLAGLVVVGLAAVMAYWKH